MGRNRIRSPHLGWFLLAASLAGCSSEREFQCLEDSACANEGIEGVCQPTGYCSFPDPDCESDYRYGDLADAFAGQCVPLDDEGSSSSADPPTTTSPDPDAPVCGDGQVDDGEACDGAPPSGASCVSQGFDGGDLGCTLECTIDESNCFRCGDGQVNGAEACDMGDFGDQTCASLDGFDGGTLKCQTNCQLDVSECATCGNGTRETGEDCDSGDLGAATCESEMFLQGMLSCAPDCTFDTSNCVTPGCGNGRVEEGEDCDGDAGGSTCEALGLGIGVTSCTDGCTIDTSLCGPPGTITVQVIGVANASAELTLACDVDPSINCSLPGADANDPWSELMDGCSIECPQGTTATATADSSPMTPIQPQSWTDNPVGGPQGMGSNPCMGLPCEASAEAGDIERLITFRYDF
ncbi:MAG: hypothetical protein AAGA54_07170 [Myxococcota bacterium]